MATAVDRRRKRRPRSHQVFAATVDRRGHVARFDRARVNLTAAVDRDRKLLLRTEPAGCGDKPAAADADIDALAAIGQVGVSNDQVEHF